jgi:hypothetical protein
MSGNRWILLLIFTLLAFCAPCVGEGQRDTSVSLETSIIDPFFSILFLRCHCDLTNHDSLVLGAYYLRAEKTFSGVSYPGLYSGIGPLLGYRRMLWLGLYLEDQLLPLYVSYGTSPSAGLAVSGFELWNEFHVGYQFDFDVRGTRLFLNAQGIVGFALAKTNEPVGFAAAEQQNPVFGVSNFYVLPNLLVGIRL